MLEWISYALAFSVSLGLVVYLTPLAIRVADRYGIHDAPDGKLKKHRKPIPYLGGFALAGGFLITFSLLSTSHSADERSLGILAGGLMILMLGLYDDLAGMPPWAKFLGQLLAVLALLKAGVVIDLEGLPHWANLTLTAFWVAGVTNAFNLIDIMDGLAAGTAFFAAFFLFLIGVFVGDDPVVPFMALALAGSLVGFLRFNFHPARIFLGDAGSMFIGFMLGALAVLVSYSDRNPAAIFAPVVLLAIPVFDTAFVSLHRTLKGRLFFFGSADHFALRVSHAGWSTRRTTIGVYLVAVALGCTSLLLVFGPPPLAPWLLALVGASAAIAGAILSRLPTPGAPTEPPKERAPLISTPVSVAAVASTSGNAGRPASSSRALLSGEKRAPRRAPKGDEVPATAKRASR